MEEQSVGDGVTALLLTASILLRPPPHPHCGRHHYRPQFLLENDAGKNWTTTFTTQLQNTQETHRCFNAVDAPGRQLKGKHAFNVFCTFCIFIWYFLFRVTYLYQCYKDDPLLKSYLTLRFVCECLEFISGRSNV